MTPHKTITIPAGFNGPPRSGNGGYAAGVLSLALTGVHTVRLLSPIPLETPLELRRDGDNTSLFNSDTCVLTARPSAVKLTAPTAPSLPAAEAASDAPIDFGADGESVCFVCGRNRASGEGLHVWCGEIEGFDGAGMVWRPHDNFYGEDGLLRQEIIWSALDCPGGFTLPPEHRRVLLGEITVDIHKRPAKGAPLIIGAWLDHSEGRKHLAGTVLFSADGQVLAQADTLWIELKPEMAKAMFG